MSRVIVLQHIDREGPGLFSKIAIEHQKDVIIFRLDLGESIPNLVDTDLLLVMGGPMGVEDLKNPNYPWLKKEVEILKFALENKIRVIGICLGAQLLAYAAGGAVEPLMFGYPKTKTLEVGWAPVNFHDLNNPLSLFDFQLRVKEKILLETSRKKRMIVHMPTGSGKTTLINAFANFYYGVDMTDDYRYHLIVENGKS